AASVTRLRTELDAAERRLAVGGVDYRAISHRNQDAVAIVLVEYTDGERYSGTAFAFDSLGTMITNKHILIGEDGTKTPQRLGVVGKALTAVIQVDAYGAPGSSGSPIFDREGNVIAMLYGGERESQGKIIFAVPAYVVADYLKSLNLAR